MLLAWKTANYRQGRPPTTAKRFLEKGIPFSADRFFAFINDEQGQCLSIP
jgi:hypothetical protein